jgi:hypothetical protein
LATVATVASLSLACTGAASASAQTPAPTNLRLIAGVESLTARWGVTSTEELAGFLVRWRPVSALPEPWSGPIERPASARGYKITGLSVRPYEVRVRAVLTGGQLGGVTTAIGTPLVQEEPPPEEEPPAESGVVSSYPRGPATPSGGWTVVYADGFARALGTGPGKDGTWEPVFHNKGCCSNLTENSVFRPARFATDARGLEASCIRLFALIEGQPYECGGGRAKSFRFTLGTAATLVFEYVCQMPKNTGEADPGLWAFSDTTNEEIDTPEFWGWTSKNTITSGYSRTTPAFVWLGSLRSEWTNGEQGLTAFDPEVGLHYYTSELSGTAMRVWLDGIKQASVGSTSSDKTKMHATITYGLREPVGHLSGFLVAGEERRLTCRSFAVYEDTAHANLGVINGGLAPGTAVK